MAFRPAENLVNRTFAGLIVAQFLAGFNDQAIHAAAMFYAMHTKILSQANAITVMPILFYAPWAIFCTIAGYLSDKYSKTATLRIWKASEIVITALMTVGFAVGATAGSEKLGGWIVMVCVFLMGTHAAFFAPAKYGAMPEVLQPHILSRGNGILESTTFLASIFGTVSGGLLFDFFRNDPKWIGAILFGLSVIGTAASFMMDKLPAASPERPFPMNPFKPIWDNLKVLFRSRPLALAVLGIAFFVFMVSYMRASMYMHGETRNPRWDEEKTSLIVATVALGVGIGSPLAGYFSGGKVELGLVPLGSIGMILALVVAAIALDATWMLVTALIIIGFFSGFYMVPLYTLLQQRAPKATRGEVLATSNFINVVGAIAASGLFKLLVYLSQVGGLTPELRQTDHVAKGTLAHQIEFDKRGRIQEVTVKPERGKPKVYRARTAKELTPAEIKALGEAFGLGEVNPEEVERLVIDFDEGLLDVISGLPAKGDQVIISSYVLRGREHYLVRRADQSLRKVYDTTPLPSYLFLGAALMTLGILIALCRKLPDFFVRTWFWMISLGRFQLKAVGMEHLPTEGPVILATNCADVESCLQLISATDRTTHVVLIADPAALANGGLMLWMARNANLIIVRPDEDATEAKQAALKTLENGHLLAVSVANDKHAADIAALLAELQAKTAAPILPVYCGALLPTTPDAKPSIRVVFGDGMVAKRESLPTAGGLDLLADCKHAIAGLGDWIRQNDQA